jgi:type I restriction enzyme, S subunit
MSQELTLSEITGEDGVFVDGDWIESKDQDINGEVRLIQLADIGDGTFLNKSNRFLTTKRARELNCTFLEPGDLLIARMPDPIGRACVFPGLKTPCVTVVDVCIVRPNKAIASTEWLKFMINSLDFRNAINKFITGTTRQRISRGNLNKLRFTLPPIKDQLLISNFLSKAESLISQRKESLRLLEEFLKSMFLEMFGNPIHDTRFDRAPLESLIDVKRGVSYGIVQRGDHRGSGVPVVRIRDVEAATYRVEDLVKTLKTISDKYKRTILEGGEILISIRGTVGKLSIAPAHTKGWNVSREVAIIPVVSEAVEKLFLLHLLRSQPVQQRILFDIKGVAQSGVNLSDLRQLPIIIPPKQLQNQFVNIVLQTDALKAEYQASLGNLEKLYKSLSYRLFKDELSFGSGVGSDETSHANVDQVSSADKTEIFEQALDQLDTLFEKGKKKEDWLTLMRYHFKNEPFLFEDLVQEAIEVGWKFKNDDAKDIILDLLREGQLKQIFIDSEFKATLSVEVSNYERLMNLEERIYLQRNPARLS